jgi:hypothetical protein
MKMAVKVANAFMARRAGVPYDTSILGGTTFEFKNGRWFAAFGTHGTHSSFSGEGDSPGEALFEMVQKIHGKYNSAYCMQITKKAMPTWQKDHG